MSARNVNVNTTNMELLGNEANLNETIEFLYNKVQEMPGPEEITYIVSPSHTNPKRVYLNPTDLTATCSSASAGSAPGTVTGCMQWYVYAYDDFNYYAILDHNTHQYVENSVDTRWNSSNESIKGY